MCFGLAYNYLSSSFEISYWLLPELKNVTQKGDSLPVKPSVDCG
jgi:hypothetical protein